MTPLSRADRDARPCYPGVLMPFQFEVNPAVSLRFNGPDAERPRTVGRDGVGGLREGHGHVTVAQRPRGNELARTRRNEHLAAAGCGGDARTPMYFHPDVVVVHDDGFAGSR